MEGKDAITMDRFVFMIDEEVEILAKQCTSHLKPSDTSPRGRPGHLSSPLPGAKVNVELPRPHMTHIHTCYRQA